MDYTQLAGLNLTKPINTVGGTNRSIQAKKFEDDLRVILMTEKGTLIGNPDFGSNMFKYLFEPSNELTASLMRDEVKEVVERYFSNVVIKNIDIEFNRNNVKMKIRYSLYVLDNEELIELNFRKGEF